MSALPVWLCGSKPARSMTCWAFTRITGIRVSDSVYAAEENSPRNRRSPTTSPFSSNVFTPT